jgi:Chemotaxis phosphatase CheX
MLPIIIEAAENFCLHQIRLPYQVDASAGMMRTLLAYIDIEAEDGSAHRAFIGCDSYLIQMIAEIFLGEESSDEETLIDMLLETTNMIVGSAKVLASEIYNTSMKIKTPFFLPDGDMDADEENISFIGVENGQMMIAIKRL